MSTGTSATMPQECNCFAVRSAARHVTQFYDQLLAPSRVAHHAVLDSPKLKRQGR